MVMDPLLKKMKFVLGRTTAVIDAPLGFPVAVSLQAAGQVYDEAYRGKYEWLVVCILRSMDVGIVVPRAMESLADKGMLWLCYPKKSGKIKTDLSRDHGWEAILHLPLRHLNLISIDDDWTAWCVEHGSPEVSEKREQRSETRNALLAAYIDAETRTMRYPPAMESLIAATPAAAAFFHQLSFTNRKEYLEWIITAKRPETKQERLQKMIEFLLAGKKNPAGR